MKSKNLFPVVSGLTAQALGLLILFSVNGCAYNGDPMLDGTFIEESEVRNVTDPSEPPVSELTDVEWSEPVDTPVEFYPEVTPAEKTDDDTTVPDIPVKKEEDKVDAKADNKTSAPDTPAANATYKVQKGDSLWKISRIYGITQQQLADANGINVKDIIRPGQILNIPAGGSNITKPKEYTPKTDAAKNADSKVAGSEITYVVVAGDSLSVIAQRHGVKTADL